ncbi:ATP-binding protein [Streptomyces sp. NPDC018029]|uniref:ATP-binding protein n=1 Tax=Streptomyces sp. NPDC018029 TaxID=3365032 RepID=UPI0037BE138D
MPSSEPWEYTLYIPHDPRAVTICRRTLRLILSLHCLPQLSDMAELLATELVSNAVRHTKGPAALRVRYRDGVLRVGAWDADPTPPATPPRAADAGEEQGRGLDLVRACADGWGWYPGDPRATEPGKHVWCELSAA